MTIYLTISAKFAKEDIIWFLSIVVLLRHLQASLFIFFSLSSTYLTRLIPLSKGLDLTKEIPNDFECMSQNLWIFLYYFVFLFFFVRLVTSECRDDFCSPMRYLESSKKKRWARKCKHLRFVSMPNAFYIGPRKRDEFDCIKWKQNAWETKRNLCLMFLSHNMLSPWRTCYAYLCVRVSVNKISLFTYICE